MSIPRAGRRATALALAGAVACATFALGGGPAAAAAGPAGDAHTPSADLDVARDPSTLWMGTFDNAPDWKSNWGIDSFPHAANNTVGPQPFAPNGKVLRTTASGDNNGFTGLGVDFRPSFDRMGIGAQDEATFRYSVYFPADFDWYEGGKLPGLSGISAGEGAFTTSAGGLYHPSSWSGRTLFVSGGRMKAYLYVKHANGVDIENNRNPANGRVYGISPLWSKNADPRQGPQLLKKGQWNHIELHYRMNTPGQNNGLFEGSMNGELGVRLTDVQYRDAAHPGLSLNQMFFTSFFGGPTSNPTDETWYFDDVSIAGSGFQLAPPREDVSAFGSATFHGATTKVALAAPLVGIAPTTSGKGYWLLARDGGIFSYGDASFRGSTGNRRLVQPVVSLASDPKGRGYWFVAGDGGIFSFGAPFFGSMGGRRLAKPIVGMAATRSGNGYSLVASDGGIFSFGDAVFSGSTGAMRLNQPIVAMAADPDGRGYWLVAADGGVFSFEAPFFGSGSGKVAAGDKVVGMAASPDGKGYVMATARGAVLAFGSSAFHGDATGTLGSRPVAGIAGTPTGSGYWLAVAR